VFDSLSDLQVAWSTDLMMGNFFCVTCPYLFELDTVALFPVLRGQGVKENLKPYVYKQLESVKARQRTFCRTVRRVMYAARLSTHKVRSRRETES